MKMLERLIDKKKKDGDELDPMYKDSKMSMLKALRDHMSDIMKDDLKSGHDGMKKVEVAADDQEGLAHGLDKAKELLGQQSESDQPDCDGDNDGDNMLSKDDDHDDQDDSSSASEMTPEEIDTLQMLLDKLKKSKMVG